MPVISELFAGGRIVDLVLAIMLVEAVALAAYHRRTRRGLAPAAVVLNLAAGAALLLALRGALVGAGWGWIALALAGALAAHLADLRQRWAATCPGQEGVSGGAAPVLYRTNRVCLDKNEGVVSSR
jgi:hypothetical protein